ncbi:tyrosine-type recombinase/integrase [Alicyclobacillus herbarius]
MVFITVKGKPVNLHNLRSRHFNPLLKAAGLPSAIVLYDLRHTCATLLLLAGENPKIVSERLGHSSIHARRVQPRPAYHATERRREIRFTVIRGLVIDMYTKTYTISQDRPLLRVACSSKSPSYQGFSWWAVTGSNR